MPYQWILFDADNTLLDFDRSEHQALKRALEERGIPFTNQYHKTYQKINKAHWLAFEEGQINKKDLRLLRFQRFFEVIGHKAEEKSFAASYLHYLSQGSFLIEGAMAQVQHLAGQYQLALVTNGLREVQRPRIAQSGLEPHFQAIIVSDEIGYSKPNPSFFEYTFDQIGQPPKEQVIIIGDNLNADIRGGAKFGIHTCWYNPRHQKNLLDVIPNYELDRLQKLKTFL